VKRSLISRIAALVCVVIFISCGSKENEFKGPAAPGHAVKIDKASEEKDPYPIEEFQNIGISEGFRGIKWATKVSRLQTIMTYHAATACGAYYNRELDEKSIFNAPIEFIRYHFRKGKFFQAAISLKKHYYKELSNELIEKISEEYGVPPEEEYSDKGKYSSVSFIWRIEDAIVVLRISERSGQASLSFTYKPILKECEKALGHKIIL